MLTFTGVDFVNFFPKSAQPPGMTTRRP
jgi:hypothetical protein